MRALLTYIFCVLIFTIPGKILAFDGKTAKNFLGLYEVKQGVLAHDRAGLVKIEKDLDLIIISNLCLMIPSF